MNGLSYCRSCIAFKRVLVGEKFIAQAYSNLNDKATYHLDYTLSFEQKEISKRIVNNYINQKNTVVQAVCGSGKTELVYDCICYALSKKEHVCFALPRRELAIEIYERLNNQFSNTKIALVHGGKTSELEGDIVICTTHQLYRYYQSFDLLIIDEIDAFPFYLNDVLKEIAYQSVKGKMIFLSATLEKSDIDIIADFIVLNRRYHNYDLPVPKIKVYPFLIALIAGYRKIKAYKKENKLVLIFVPTIARTKVIKKYLSYLGLKTKLIHSKTKDKASVLELFKAQEIDALITTTLLERGITFSNVQVLVYDSEHQVFNHSTLIQIAGRVGRKPDYPSGDVIFYTSSKSQAMIKCIQKIKEMNTV